MLVVQARDVRVKVGDNFFEPATLTVAVGDTVTWAHEGNRPHDVTADNGSINSPRRMANGQTFTYTATTAGTFTYLCTIHSQVMKGTLIVQAGGGGPARPRAGAGGMAGGDLSAESLLMGFGLAAVAGLAAGRLWRR
jgi:plastocyanin